MNRHARSVAVVLTVAASALIFFAMTALARPAHASGTTIHLKGGEFFFKPNKPVAARGKITIIFTNVGHVGHDLKLAGKHTPIVQPGKSARIFLKLTRSGNYPFSCTVPGHAQAGMRGLLKVR